MKHESDAQRNYIGLLIGILLVAFFLRVHTLDTTPPGMHYDEGFNSLDALDLLRNGNFQVFYAKNNGREPLHILVNALFIALTGTAPWVLRYATALVGVLAVPIVYRTAHAVVPRRAWRTPVALLAAAVLATTIWHVEFSRFILRAVYLVPLSALAVWRFWVHWQRGSPPRRFVWSGLFLGLSLYTYIPARLLPVVFVIPAGVALLRRDTGRRKALAGGLIVTLATAFLVFLPLGIYFVNNPEAFAERMSQTVAIEATDVGSSAESLTTNIIGTARMFFDAGDRDFWHNLPGRPVFDPLVAIGFAVGVMVALWNWRKAWAQLLLVWLTVMLLPMTLSDDVPKSIRAIGAVPPALILAGTGLWWIWHRLTRRRQLAVAWPVLLVLFVSGSLTARDYFQRWAAVAEVREGYGIEYNFGRNMIALSADRDVVVPGEIFAHPTIQYLLTTRFEPFTEDQTLAPTRPTTFLYPDGVCRLNRSMVLLHADADGSGVIRIIHPQDVPFTPWLRAADGEPRFLDAQGYNRVYEIDERTNAAVDDNAQATGATFDKQICLTGMTTDERGFRPNETAAVTLHWEKLDPDAPPVVAVAHLIAPDGSVAGDPATQPLPDEWEPGTTATTQHEFTLPPDAPSGIYHIDVEVVDSAEKRNLEHVSDQGVPFGPTARSGNIAVFAPAVALQPLALTWDAPTSIALTGYQLPSGRTGEPIVITLAWESMAPIAQDATVFIHIENADGNSVAQRDAQPLDGRAPTSQWYPGDVWFDTHSISAETPLPPGTYRVAFGLYDWMTGDRLSLFDADGQRVQDDRVYIPEPLIIRE
ncbi:MAG: glycosyltransferase family 39 protein [Anaerolineae bacterium]|nr:glycosyltransferase family 39 protein [Anaerolineae bacterium]